MADKKIGLSTLTACQTGQMSSNLTGIMVPAQAAQSGQTMNLQAALANYHDVDASFADNRLLAESGGLKTQLLGIGLIEDLLDEVMSPKQKLSSQVLSSLMVIQMGLI